MNQDEITNIVQLLLTAAGAILVTHGLVTSTEWTSLAGAVMGLVGPVWSIFYSHWNMKKVPETAKVIAGAVLAAVFLSLMPAGGQAADMPKKAAPLPNFLSTAYPTTSGIYFGLGTMGGGGTVNASVTGVNSNSLVSNQIGVSGIVGYAWNVPNSQMFAAAEGWFGWQNFNGSQQGFALTGPATFTQRVMFGAPLSDITQLFPTLGVAVPPFPTLPGGQTATNIKPYLAATFTEDDVTLDIAGMGSNRDWRFSPGIAIGALGQLTSGSVVDVFAMTKFPQRGLCVGPGLPAGQPCGSVGTTYLAGLALKW